ncbi:arginyl-tRNA synthetase [Pseudarthrobacter oxydans]|uniref:arginine--tRNA ligase n=1 Tax=Pseudarthrobacter oxydans TaxID=1671 RepID=UPI002785100A|nr:arginine--tRNA ligase [Pseudarthrobacter oxydans]MDP9982243.1 arginyl-tRNA synthetase [Pseudarthrobacter oxydans]
MVVPRVQAAIASAFGEEYRETDPVVRPSQFADIQINAAMALAKKVGMAPRDAAARIVEALDLDGICTAVEISGPGFINLTFDGTWIEELLNAASPGAPALPAAEAQRVVVDYSSPNVAKEMHVGHLRTTVVGDSLVKVLEALGDTVIRQNHIGDWGTPFGMLIEHWLEIGEDSPEAALLVDDPSAFYQAARAKFDASATDEDGFATRARQRVVALQSGDEETFAVWQRLVAQSKRYFNAIYSMLGISLTDDHIAGESSYDAHLAQLCQELEERGIARISDGALCTFPAGFTGRDGEPMPLIIRKSDGGYGYGTTDLATIRYRVRELEANRVLYVVGAPQNMHLRMVMATAREAGWLPDTVEAVHVQIGNVLGEDGKILKSRSGAPVKLMALLEEAVDRARAVIDASRPELTEAERAVTARQVGIGAVKYADLSVGHDTEYVFDFDRMLALSGNTGPYVQYAAARIRSILRKAGVLERYTAVEAARIDGGTPGTSAGTRIDGGTAATTAGTVIDGGTAATTGVAETAGTDSDGGIPATPIAVVEPAERALALHLLEYGATLHKVREALEPHRLCTYLFELAQLFTAFYDQCPVLKSEDSVRESRLALCALVLHRLSEGLDLLGIETPENM